MRESPARIIRGVYTGLLDLIYPPFCVVCGEAGEDYLCAKCIEKIDVIGRQHCRIVRDAHGKVQMHRLRSEAVCL